VSEVCIFVTAIMQKVINDYKNIYTFELNLKLKTKELKLRTCS